MSAVGKKSIEKRVQNAFEFFVLGHGWKAHLLRLCVVVISFILNPFDFAVHQSATAPMKFFLLTCAFLAYTFIMLIIDYKKRGKINGVEEKE